MYIIIRCQVRCQSDVSRTYDKDRVQDREVPIFISELTILYARQIHDHLHTDFEPDCSQSTRERHKR